MRVFRETHSAENNTYLALMTQVVNNGETEGTSSELTRSLGSVFGAV